MFNIAEGSDIFVNATCGEHESEVYCVLDSGHELECGVCDDSKESKSHPVDAAVDGADNTWWQSPSLQYGPGFHHVTVTVDLKNVFQVAYVIIKCGPSPRPGNWVLERSVDGHAWAPWQFFAISDDECWHTFGVEPTRGKPKYSRDEQVICTSYYSDIVPLKDGEIHVPLVNGRPGVTGANRGPSQTLVDFTQARFVRLRFQRLLMLPQDQMLDYDVLQKIRLRQYFYSMREITIGGQCPCNGHAEHCPVHQATMVGTVKLLKFLLLMLSGSLTTWRGRQANQYWYH